MMVDGLDMRFDPIITNAGRLTILTALCDKAKQDFVSLRKVTRLTDGNLTTHARKLADAGMIAIEKSAHEGKSVTFIRLTDQGRTALQDHIDQLTQSVASASVPEPVYPHPQPHEQGAWID